MTNKPRAFASGIGLILLATLAAGIYRIQTHRDTKVIVGTKDEVYYSGYATKEEARALGRALTTGGFLTNKGMTVLLWRGKAGSTVSFVVNQDAWTHADTVANYEVIGRRVAPWLGGFPIRVHLIDASGKTRKDLAIGRIVTGTKDEVYYFGTATKEDAEALGQALVAVGFFTNQGATVAVSKGDVTELWFVTNEGFWEIPAAIAGFETVARRVAGTVGGLPIQVRLLNAEMETKKQLIVGTEPRP